MLPEDASESVYLASTRFLADARNDSEALGRTAKHSEGQRCARKESVQGLGRTGPESAQKKNRSTLTRAPAHYNHIINN